MNLRVAKSIDEYLSIVSEIKADIKNEVWFRGQSNASHYLLPSLFREKATIGLEYSGSTNYKYRKSDAIMKSDFSALEKFILEYDKLLKPSKKLNKVDYLYLMQHYDIPTRLLDFSRDELIALYFSLSKKVKSDITIEEEIDDFYSEGGNLINDYTESGYSNNGSCIYLISPHYTNLKSNNNETVYDLSLTDFETLKRIDLPICIKTDFDDSRLVAQKGVFVFFGIMYNYYEYYNILKQNIYKIFIPNSVRNEMFEELKSKYHITHSKVFPDMKGVSLEIIDEIEKKYIDDCNRVFNNNNNQ